MIHTAVVGRHFFTSLNLRRWIEFGDGERTEAPIIQGAPASGRGQYQIGNFGPKSGQDSQILIAPIVFV